MCPNDLNPINFESKHLQTKTQGRIFDILFCINALLLGYLFGIGLNNFLDLFQR